MTPSDPKESGKSDVPDDISTIGKKSDKVEEPRIELREVAWRDGWRWMHNFLFSL